MVLYVMRCNRSYPFLQHILLFLQLQVISQALLQDFQLVQLFFFVLGCLVFLVHLVALDFALVVKLSLPDAFILLSILALPIDHFVLGNEVVFD